MIRVTVMEDKMKRDAIIKKVVAKKRRVYWKRVILSVIALLSFIVGIVLIVCNETKTVPAEWGTSLITDFCFFFISVGIFAGPMFIFIGIYLVTEIKEDYPRKTKRRTR